MSNWSLKYRPRSFDDVAGNEKTVKELKKRIKDKNFPKVVMFAGMTGTGKTTMELIYVKSLLCENPKDGNCCNECKYCKMIDNDLPNEFITILNGSNINIDEMRYIEEKTSRKLLSFQNKKIIIIDEMQEINIAKTQKAILKLLEKENDNTYFCLGTMNRSKIDNAILNRSLVYNVTLTIPDIRNYLIKILRTENITATPELANMIVAITNNCNNSMRTAISYLERVVLSELKTEDELYQELGIMSETKIIDFINGLLKGDIQILQTKPDQNLLDQIKQKLVLLYEYNCGLDLNSWQKQQLQGLNKVNNNVIETVLSILQELTLFPYLNQTIIEFQIVKCITNIHKLLNVQVQIEKPKRGRD